MKAFVAAFLIGCFSVALAAKVSTNVDLTDPTKWNCGLVPHAVFPIDPIVVSPSTSAGQVQLDATFDNGGDDEYISLSCESVSFGPLNAGTPSGIWSVLQSASSDCALDSGTASLTGAQVSALTSDGQINCIITLSFNVDYCCNPDTATLSFTIGAASYTSIVDLSDPDKWNCGVVPSGGADTFPIDDISTSQISVAGAVVLEAVFDNSGSGEYLSLICEGIDFGPLNEADYYSDSWDEIVVSTYDDCETDKGIAQLSAAQMTQLTSDGVIKCTITTSSDVDFCCIDYNSVPDVATVTFYYDTDAPVTTFTVDDNTVDAGVTVTGTIVTTDVDEGITAWYYTCDQAAGGPFTQTKVVVAANTQQTYTFTCSYPLDGLYCAAICVADYVDDCNTLLSSSSACSGRKRAGSLLGQSIQVGVVNAGDPYFQGFDGKVFSFNGILGHMYNYISSPTLQLNGLIAVGASEDNIHHMHSITRQVGVIWDKDQKLRYECDLFGKTLLEIWSGEDQQWVSLPGGVSNETMYINLGSSHLVWEPTVNVTRHPLHLAPHQVSSKLTLVTADYILDIFSVTLTLENRDSTQRFHFIDQSFTRRHQAQQQSCLEGVWGRTTCVSGSSAFDMELYDLQGDLFGDFALNLFQGLI